MAKCKYCGKEISWLKEGKKFVPLESDGTIHECENYKSSRKSIKNISVGDISAEELKKYEENINNKK